MDCPKCKSKEKVKDGKTGNRQRYKCKNCGFHFSVEKRSTEKSEHKKRLALTLYLEGLDFRTIGNVLDINFVTVYYWIKKWKQAISLLKSEYPIERMKLDKFSNYTKNKKINLRSKLLIIDLEKGTSTLFTEKVK